MGLLLVLAVWPKGKPADKQFLKIGVRRIATGYLGGLAATAIYASIYAYLIGLNKVDLGHIPADGLADRLLGWSMYVFFLFAPLVVLILSLAGLPLFALLSKYRFGSFVGVASIAASLAVVYAASVFASPYNLWCGANQVRCVAQAFVDFGIPALLVASGFALGAKLPLVREMPRAPI